MAVEKSGSGNQPVRYPVDETKGDLEYAVLLDEVQEPVIIMGGPFDRLGWPLEGLLALSGSGAWHGSWGDAYPKSYTRPRRRNCHPPRSRVEQKVTRYAQGVSGGMPAMSPGEDSPRTPLQGPTDGVVYVRARSNVIDVKTCDVPRTRDNRVWGAPSALRVCT